MARTERREAFNACKKHSRTGCDYGVTGEYKRPARRFARRLGKREIREQRDDG